MSAHLLAPLFAYRDGPDGRAHVTQLANWHPFFSLNVVISTVDLFTSSEALGGEGRSCGAVAKLRGDDSRGTCNS